MARIYIPDFNCTTNKIGKEIGVFGHKSATNYRGLVPYYNKQTKMAELLTFSSVSFMSASFISTSIDRFILRIYNDHKRLQLIIVDNNSQRSTNT